MQSYQTYQYHQILFMAIFFHFFFAGGNSTASFGNITNLTASNGIVNQLMPTTTPSDSKAKKDASYPTSVPPMFRSASRRNRNQGIAMNSSLMQGQSGGIKEGPNSTEPGMEVDGKTGDQGTEVYRLKKKIQLTRQKKINCILLSH